MCYHMGVNSPLGAALLCLYVLCAIIRLAFFNVIEGKRQQTESGCNKVYRGLPVTTIAILFPPVYLIGMLLSASAFVTVLYVMMPLVAFLFVLDFSVPKPDWSKLLSRKRGE